MNKKKVKILILVISCIIIVTVFGSPFFVDLCSPHKKSEISADGILGYIIGALGSLSTIALSSLALWQTKHIQDENDKSQDRMNKAQKALNDAHEELNRLNNRMLELEENNYKIKLRPFVILTSYIFEVYSKDDIKNDKLWFGLDIDSEDVIKSKKGCFYGLTLSFVNTSDSVISITDSWEANEDTWKNNRLNLNCKKIILLPAEVKQVVFIATKEFFCKMFGKTVCLSFILENRFAKRFRESFELYFHYISFGNEKFNCYLFDEKYSLIRFVKNEKGELVEVEEEL